MAIAATPPRLRRLTPVPAKKFGAGRETESRGDTGEKNRESKRRKKIARVPRINPRGPDEYRLPLYLTVPVTNSTARGTIDHRYGTAVKIAP